MVLSTKRLLLTLSKFLWMRPIMIKLYAQRRREKGFAFSADNYLQHTLEASFLYEDTPDQNKATQEVKKDMESGRPMDRLVCGDVGFGKTEVAIRAAFKASRTQPQQNLQDLPRRYRAAPACRYRR